MCDAAAVTGPIRPVHSSGVTHKWLFLQISDYRLKVNTKLNNKLPKLTHLGWGVTLLVAELSGRPSTLPHCPIPAHT